MDRNDVLAVSALPELIVALRKESVDRNVNLRVLDGSKSSVALRKESVDRNPIVPAELTTLVSRSPQGERG